MRISALDRQRIAIWGFGREGRAALKILRWRLPDLPVTVLCTPAEAKALASGPDFGVSVSTDISVGTLSSFDVIIKSPGISPYTPIAIEAARNGVRFTSGTALWFAENTQAKTICVTGTKGKSTVSSLIAHFLRAAGKRTALAGNIGIPLLELMDATPSPEYWVIELSSYQTRDALQPALAVTLNLYPEHLDWHGSQARYYADKLALITHSQPKNVLINANDPTINSIDTGSAGRYVFNDASGWHVHAGVIMRGNQPVLDIAQLPLRGRHNAINVCAALAAVDIMGFDAVRLAPHAAGFKGLPHRLQTLGMRNGIEYVNDSISTTPYASLAALDCFPDRPVAIIVGGYDRGIDWGVFSDRIASRPPKAVIATGQNGPRIYQQIKSLAAGGKFQLFAADEMDEAVAFATQALGNQGVLLLSPGAPSFPRYLDYVERAQHFAKCCGFDPELISTIPGLGIS